MNQIFLADNLDLLPKLPDKFASLIYIDPPFNTGRTQKRIGRDGSYEDSFENFEEFLMPRIKAALHCLKDNGSLFVHLDCREVHYIKVALDKLLGRDCFMNEIIWHYDFGGRSKKKWSAKHDNILWYALNPKDYIFYSSIDRIPYMSEGWVTGEKHALGKTPTDCWWHTIVPTNGKEKTGYPTQKPMGIVNRIIKIHSNPGDTVLDFFAGSGTMGMAAGLNGREFCLIDKNPEAVNLMRVRLDEFEHEVVAYPKHPVQWLDLSFNG